MYTYKILCDELYASGNTHSANSLSILKSFAFYAVWKYTSNMAAWYHSDVTSPCLFSALPQKSRSGERSRRSFAGRRIRSSRETCAREIPPDRRRWRRESRFRFRFRSCPPATWRFVVAAACGPWRVGSETRSSPGVRTARLRPRWTLCAATWCTCFVRTRPPVRAAASPCKPFYTCLAFSSCLKKTRYRAITVKLRLTLTDERTYAVNKIWYILVVKCDIWWQ